MAEQPEPHTQPVKPPVLPTQFRRTIPRRARLPVQFRAAPVAGAIAVAPTLTATAPCRAGNPTSATPPRSSLLADNTARRLHDSAPAADPLPERAPPTRPHRRVPPERSRFRCWFAHSVG